MINSGQQKYGNPANEQVQKLKQNKPKDNIIPSPSDL